MDEYTIYVVAELLLSIVGVGLGLLMIVSYCKIFENAGEDGWKALIPFYNAYIMYEITWGSGWMFLCSAIPLIGFIFPIVLTFKLARAFGHSIAFGIGMLLLPFVFYPILAFSDNVYLGPI